MYFSKEFRRKQRRELTYLILEYINYYNMPHNVIEFVIKSFHFQHIFLSYFSLLFLPKTAFINVFWVSLILFLLFFYLDGCVLSNVEYKLCKNKKQFINIIDPLLYVLGKEINITNRYFYTLYFALVYFAGCIIKFVHIYSNN
jgi:hypothetical protein